MLWKMCPSKWIKASSLTLFVCLLSSPSNPNLISLSICSKSWSLATFIIVTQIKSTSLMLYQVCSFSALSTNKICNNPNKILKVKKVYCHLLKKQLKIYTSKKDWLWSWYALSLYSHNKLFQMFTFELVY